MENNNVTKKQNKNQLNPKKKKDSKTKAIVYQKEE